MRLQERACVAVQALEEIATPYDRGALVRGEERDVRRKQYQHLVSLLTANGMGSIGQGLSSRTGPKTSGSNRLTGTCSDSPLSAFHCHSQNLCRIPQALNLTLRQPHVGPRQQTLE
jgi:hypothetical protein